MLKLNIQNLIILISLLIFIYGFYSILNYKEGFDIINDIENDFKMLFPKNNCPNLLIQKNGKYLMYNTNKSNVPGVNPISFDNLEEYTQFHKWLRSQGINCPILYLQQMYDTQGNNTYRILPDPNEPNLGLPITKLYDAGHNKGSMPGFDPQNQYIGDNTPLDNLFHEEERTQKLSDNPMDYNWGGPEYSEDVVQSGKYSDDQIYYQIN